MSVNLIRKIMSRINRAIILRLDYINTDLYMKKYTKWLKKNGMDIHDNVKYICPDVYFDGHDYSRIHIGSNVTISTEVMLLTHDYSLTTALATQGKYINRHEGELYKISDITITEDTFVGARASILPGTTIGKNVIIGACAVVKGTIPDDSIVIGNPGRIIGKTSEYAKRLIEEGNYLIEE